MTDSQLGMFREAERVLPEGFRYETELITLVVMRLSSSPKGRKQMRESLDHR